MQGLEACIAELRLENISPLRVHELLQNFDAKSNKALHGQAEKTLQELLQRGLITLGSSRALAQAVTSLGTTASLNFLRMCLGLAAGSLKTTLAKAAASASSSSNSSSSSSSQDAPRLAAVYVAGFLHSIMQLDSGSMQQDTAEKLQKFVKSSKTLREAALLSLNNLLSGLGESGRLVHETSLKVLKSSMSEKMSLTRLLSARCLGSLATHGTGAIMEPAFDLLMRLLEDNDSSVYAEAQASLAKALSCAVARAVAAGVSGSSEDVGGAGSSGGGGSSNASSQAHVDGIAQWSMVNAVKYACAAIRKSNNVIARGGIGYAVSQLLFDSPLHVKEDGLGSIVSVVLGLVIGVEDVLQLRGIASHILRHGIGKTLGTSGRRKFFAILAKSVENSNSNDWVRVVAFAEMAFLTLELGEESADLLSDGAKDLLKRFVSSNFPPLRNAAICNLLTYAESNPASGAMFCTEFIESVTQASQSSDPADLVKLLGGSSALAALLAEGARSEFGLPQALTDSAWNLGLSLATGNVGGKAPSGWAILGSLFLFGPEVVTPGRINDIFSLLKAAVVVNEKLSNERAVIGYIKRNENLLSAVQSLLQACMSLLAEQHLLTLGQILNQILSTVSSIPPAQPGSGLASAVHIYRMALYEVFMRLPSQHHQSSAVALLKAMTADLVEGGVMSSSVRKDLPSSDFVLESLTYASNTDLFESPSPDVSVAALRNKEMEKRLFLETSTAVAVIDKAISLLPVVFCAQSAKRQSQVLLHLLKCSSSPSPNQQKILANCLCAAGRMIHALSKSRTPIGAGQTLTAIINWLKQASVDADPLIRRGAARVLGYLCRLEGAQLTIAMFKHGLALLQQQQGASVETISAGALIIGTIHKASGAIHVASFQEAAANALIARLGNKDTDAWILHALWLMIEARGPGYAPLANSTLEQTYSMLAGQSAYFNPLVFILLGRVVNAIVSVLGLELQPGSRTFSRFNAISVELKAYPHALVQQESLHFKQMLILFAPRTVDVPSLVLFLRRELRSPFVSLRTAAVICTNQLLQMSPEAIVDQRLEQELFFMLDNALDKELNEQLQKLIGGIVEVLAVAAPSRLIKLCKEILEAKELRKPKGGIGAFSGPTGDEGKLKYADEQEEDDDKEPAAAAPENEASAITEDQTFMPSIQTKRYCISCVGRVVNLLKSKPEHVDLKLAREAQRGKNADCLISSLRELVNIASRAAGSNINALRKEGMLLLELVVNTFAEAVDPDYEAGPDDVDEGEEFEPQSGPRTELLLKQYVAQISSAITSSLSSAPPSVMAAACRVSASFLCSNIRYDLYSLNRSTDLLGRILRDIYALKQFDMFSWKASSLVQVAVLEVYSKLACISGINKKRVMKFVEPLLPQLLDLWLALLNDCVAVELPWISEVSFPSRFFVSRCPVAEDVKKSFMHAGPYVLEAIARYHRADNDNARKVIVGMCIRGASNAVESPDVAISSLTSLSHLLGRPETVELLQKSGVLDEFLELSLVLLKGSPQVRLACVKIIGTLIGSITSEQVQKDNTWKQLLDSCVSCLTSQIFSHLPSLAETSPAALLPGQLPQAVLDIVSECLKGLSSVQFDVSLTRRLGPALLRLSVQCLRLGGPALEAASFTVIRKLLVLPQGASAEDKEAWEDVLSAVLGSLVVPLSTEPSKAVLQACVAVFSILSHKKPNVACYAVVADTFIAALKLESSQLVALSCLRTLLESAFRARDEAPAFYAQVLPFVGSVCPEVVRLACARRSVAQGVVGATFQQEGEEELRIFVLAHALAGFVGPKEQASVLEVLLPGLVSLLNPDSGSAPHDAVLNVLMSLAQNAAHADAFKTAVAKLAPANMALLQQSLKRKAEADAREKEADARKQKLKASTQQQKIGFANWGAAAVAQQQQQQNTK